MREQWYRLSIAKARQRAVQLASKESSAWRRQGFQSPKPDEKLWNTSSPCLIFCPCTFNRLHATKWRETVVVVQPHVALRALSIASARKRSLQRYPQLFQHSNLFNRSCTSKLMATRLARFLHAGRSSFQSLRPGNQLCNICVVIITTQITNFP